MPALVTMTRYHFLAILHAELRPKTYLDIGVQNGHSLKLASPDCMSIGVDPEPTPLAYAVAQQVGARIYPITSDAFFAEVGPGTGARIDLTSIDGMHLFEYALRDFIGSEVLASPGGVIVFDDVSPYSSAIAARTQPPGDWTGDVWKIRPILDEHRPDLATVLVDTFPTGTLAVWNLDPSSTVLRDRYAEIERTWLDAGETVPDDILNDRGVPASVAIEMIKGRAA